MGITNFFNFFIERLPEVHSALIQHIKISGMAVALAIIVGVPTGIAITKSEKLSKVILSIAGIFQTIPSLALFGLIIPFLGIGIKPAIFVLFLYSLLPIITNTYIGIKNVDQSTIQAAVGMGMTNLQVLLKVKLPIAISVIMGGIRISAVANIGTATIAALIGAGGLGELIFRGISTSNNLLVLTGAIPTALLAFVVNYVLGVFEVCLTPTGMLTDRNSKKKNLIIMRILLILFILLGARSAYKKFITVEKPTIIVGHKNYTEQRILGKMMEILIEENTDYEVNLIEFGATNIIMEAIQSSEIDLYPEYTGTIYAAVLNQKGITDPKMVRDIIKEAYNREYGLDILDHMGFQNTYAFAVTQDAKDKYNLKTIEDLRKVDENLVLSGPHEFMEREDGLLGIRKAYNLKFKDILSMDQGLVITSLISDKVEIAVVYSTDGLIAKHNLVLLEDNRNFFPPYEVVVTLRKGYDQEKPDVIAAVNKLYLALTEDDMQLLNLEAVEGKTTLDQSVRTFLKTKGLIQ